jgi:hypothetical protein
MEQSFNKIFNCTPEVLINQSLIKANVDVSVLLWIFIRPEKIKKVFDVLKEARPSRLFLVSDGPRAHIASDKDNIARSREIVADVTWECEIHRLYFDDNQGMYPIHKITNEYIFKLVDRCIYLEDDVITSVSFFKYCEVLLEKYKDDLRVNMICGMNHLGIYEDCPNDYFFTKGSSIWGFALWRRTYELFNDLGYGDEKYYMDRLLENANNYESFCEKLEIFTKDKNYWEHPPSFEFFLGLSSFAHNQLSIVPKKNMVCNIGYGADATHNNSELELMPKRLKQFFNMKTYELEFPLNHPKYIIEDKNYEGQLMSIMGRTFFSQYLLRLEGFYLRHIKYFNMKRFQNTLKRILFLR